jgi:hypothetical protein
MRAATLFVIALTACTIASGAQTGKDLLPASSQKALPSLSAEEIFKRVSPSVMVVESLDANGKVTTLGSGVVIAPGLVITNRHVIKDGVTFRVEHGDDAWNARLAWVDPDHDLALLRATGLQVPPVPFRSSPTVLVGERVYAIGSPEGLELSLSQGIVSGLREYQGGYVIQTSAPVSPGSSGGGLFDKAGRLVGITSFGLVEGQNLNFALPAEWVEALPRHSAAGGRPDQQQPTEKEKDVFANGVAALWNLGVMVQDRRKVDSPSYEVPPNGSGTMEVASLVLNCLFDSKSPDCPDNWPAWQQAAIRMLDLREAIRAAEPSRNELESGFTDLARGAWSDLTDVYCHERPGGTYTDLEGKIRSCPTSPQEAATE